MPRNDVVARGSRRVLVTGADGFIGKNTVIRLRESAGVVVSTFVRGDDRSRLPSLLADADAVVHLAGENRPADEAAFAEVNGGLTIALCEAIDTVTRESGRQVPLVLASSIQAERDNPYGRSKLAAEKALESLAARSGNPCIIFRLPGVFGKWCRPGYNSVVATFCHNIARGLPVRVDDPMTPLRLVYIDDVVDALIAATDAGEQGVARPSVTPEYGVTLGELVEQIRSFGECRSSLMTERVGTGFARKLYSTYISCLPTDNFSYAVPHHPDPRGTFVEMLKTRDSGQFSYFTAHPGVTRGGHYHHTKTEKFLVIKGTARFRFRHLITGELVEFLKVGQRPEIVDTIPGWSHDITNIGAEEMVVMLWANENFDRQRPDTVASKV